MCIGYAYTLADKSFSNKGSKIPAKAEYAGAFALPSAWPINQINLKK
jgi:hypothetical protein